MGWRGTVRSIQAATRRAEREAQRKQRELEKQEKLYAKMEALEQARYEVAVYENRLEVLQSVHKEWGDLIDWESILSTSAPTEPINEHIREDNFKAVFLQNYWEVKKNPRRKLSKKTKMNF